MFYLIFILCAGQGSCGAVQLPGPVFATEQACKAVAVQNIKPNLSPQPGDGGNTA